MVALFQRVNNLYELYWHLYSNKLAYKQANLVLKRNE